MLNNTASGISEAAKNELLTAGMGFWFGFYIDVTAALADDVLELFMQSGFRFQGKRLQKNNICPIFISKSRYPKITPLFLFEKKVCYIQI
ncbi:MAG: hypothetical protein WBN96_00660 [Gammaproteobacteria bacterium]